MDDNWQLSIFAILFFPFGGYIIGQIEKQLKKKSIDGQQQWRNLMAQMEETLSELRIIKAFNAKKIVKKNDLKKQTIPLEKLADTLITGSNWHIPSVNCLGL